MENQPVGENRIAQMERKRRQMLSSGVIAFALWQILSILGDTTSLYFPLKAILIMLSLVAWGVWSFNLTQILRFGKEMTSEPATARALSDERWAQNRLKAFVAGFVAVMIAQGALILLFLAVPFDAMIAARVTITVGVTASIAAFLYFDRD